MALSPVLRRRLARRGARALVTLLGITLATFLLLRLLPGDPALVKLHGFEVGRISPQAYREMLQEIGWEEPLHRQYLGWVGAALRGDLGDSISDGRPVAARIRERLPASLLLNGVSLSAVFLAAVPLGLLMARYRGRALDRGTGWLLFLLFALPNFWIAGLLQAALAVRLPLFPMHGMFSLGSADAGALTRGVDLLWHLVLPALCLTYGQLAFLARFTRATVLESLGADFIRTARAKGLAESTVLWRHAFRTAVIPLLTLFGLTLPALIGGSVLIETIFSWPGLGSLFFESLERRDYPVVMALTLLSAVLTLGGNLIADLLYQIADPRAARSPA